MGQENAYIKGDILREKDRRIIEIGLSQHQKRMMKSNGWCWRDWRPIGAVQYRTFSPEDLKLVKEGPVERRAFLDREISKLKPSTTMEF